MDYRETKIQLRDIFENEKEATKALQLICNALHTKLEHYNWVGFYFMNNKTLRLTLGPFAGEPTEHVSIPYGQGICGQVAESGETFLVDDVSAQSNYIACSISTKSEIVVPLFVNDTLVGQIDIDSEKPKAFTTGDELFLKDLNAIIAQYYGAFLIKQQQELEKDVK
jgi:GAF domain-containing protein